MNKLSRATNEEINQYIKTHYGDINVNSLSPSEQADIAGEISNNTGKIVYAHGINWHPNKPKNQIGITGTNAIIILFIIMFGFIVCGFITWGLSSLGFR